MDTLGQDRIFNDQQFNFTRNFIEFLKNLFEKKEADFITKDKMKRINDKKS